MYAFPGFLVQHRVCYRPERRKLSAQEKASPSERLVLVGFCPLKKAPGIVQALRLRYCGVTAAALAKIQQRKKERTDNPKKTKDTQRRKRQR